MICGPADGGEHRLNGGRSRGEEGHLVPGDQRAPTDHVHAERIALEKRRGFPLAPFSRSSTAWLFVDESAPVGPRIFGAVSALTGAYSLIRGREAQLLNVSRANRERHTTRDFGIMPTIARDSKVIHTPSSRADRFRTVCFIAQCNTFRASSLTWPTPVIGPSTMVVQTGS